MATITTFAPVARRPRIAKQASVNQSSSDRPTGVKSRSDAKHAQATPTGMPRARIRMTRERGNIALPGPAHARRGLLGHAHGSPRQEQFVLSRLRITIPLRRMFAELSPSSHRPSSFGS
jgi:hypothetical protein